MYLFIDKQKTDFSEFDNLIPETEDVIEKQQTDSLFIFNPNTLKYSLLCFLKFSRLIDG